MRFYRVDMCYRNGGVFLRVPEDCAYLTSIIREKGKYPWTSAMGMLRSVSLQLEICGTGESPPGVQAGDC